MSTPIQITGNLTADPELQYLPNGRPAARFTVAVNSRRRTEAGEWVDGEPTFYPVTAWGEQGEHVAESLTKGARVVILGTIKARSWAPTEGERVGEILTRLEVTAETVAASLQWATVTVSKAKRGGPRSGPLRLLSREDPSATVTLLGVSHRTETDLRRRPS